VPHALEASARRWLPRALAPAIGWLGEAWPRSRQLPKPLRVGTLLENLSPDPAGAYFADLTFLKTRDTRVLMGLPPARDLTSSPVYERVTEPYRRCSSAETLLKAAYGDLT